MFQRKALSWQDVTYRQILNRVPAFWGVDEPTKDKLAEALIDSGPQHGGSLKRVYKARHVIDEGQSLPKYVIVVCSGVVAIAYDDDEPHGMGTLSSIRSSGDVTLDAAVLSHERGKFRRVAMTDCLSLLIPADVFIGVLAACGPFLAAVMREHYVFGQDTARYSEVPRRLNDRSMRIYAGWHMLLRSVKPPLATINPERPFKPYRIKWLNNQMFGQWVDHPADTVSRVNRALRGAGIMISGPGARPEFDVNSDDTLQSVLQWLQGQVDVTLPTGPTHGLNELFRR